MSIYEGLLIVGAFAVILISRGNSRGIVWVLAITADLVISTAYWRANLGHGELVAGLCDATVCVLIYLVGMYRWELFIWRLMQSMLLVNMLYLATHVFGVMQVSQDIYASILEAINWIALLYIGGVSAFQANGHTDVRAFRPWPRVWNPLGTVYQAPQANRGAGPHKRG